MLDAFRICNYSTIVVNSKARTARSIINRNRVEQHSLPTLCKSNNNRKVMFDAGLAWPPTTSRTSQHHRVGVDDEEDDDRRRAVELPPWLTPSQQNSQEDCEEDDDESCLDFSNDETNRTGGWIGDERGVSVTYDDADYDAALVDDMDHEDEDDDDDNDDEEEERNGLRIGRTKASVWGMRRKSKILGCCLLPPIVAALSVRSVVDEDGRNNLMGKVAAFTGGFVPRPNNDEFRGGDELGDEFQNGFSATSDGNADFDSVDHPKTDVEEQDEVVQIPPRYGKLAPLSEPFDEDNDVPVFWHVGRSGGTTMQTILSHCIGLVEASQVGVTFDDHDKDEELQIVHVDDALYVNVDTTTLSGLHRASNLGLVSSGVADYVYTPLMFEAMGILFTHKHRGRMFSLMRHPVDRSVSLFYHLRTAKWEDTYDPLLATMSIEEYAVRSQTEHNWMVRFLTNVGGGQLFERHLAQAKEILREKCLVGFTDRFDESLDRFERYFGWKVNGPAQVACRDSHVKVGDNAHDHPPLSEDSEAWNQLMRRNYFDLQLYEYALTELWEQQTALF